MSNPSKILIVDDDAIIRKTCEAKLTAAGHKVVLAREALAAVGLARAEKPDVILLDIHFPTDLTFSSLAWDGLNVLQWFKRFEDLTSIPICVMSGDKPEACEKKALEAGAAVFLQKPIDFDQFLASLPRILAGKQESA
jgi:CheY-like chemotaxis protein